MAPPTILLEASHLEIWEKHNISLKLKLKQVLSPKQLKIGFSPFWQSFVLDIVRSFSEWRTFGDRAESQIRTSKSYKIGSKQVLGPKHDL
jgi:hypothetical protein